jgi:hypothetical protein
MLAAGHSSVASHQRYQNLTKTDLKRAFGVQDMRAILEKGNIKIVEKVK